MSKTQLAILGLGSRSTLYYLEQLNKVYNAKNGGYSTCPFFLLNTDFDTINPLLPNTSVQLDAILQGYLDQIEALEVAEILIPNITLHETIDRLELQKNILHPLPLSVLKMKEIDAKKVMLLGSLHSMKSSYIRSYLELNSIEVLLPSSEDMVCIDEVRKHIYNTTETKEIINKYHQLIKKYSENYPVILGCTELSILKPIDQRSLIDMAQLQIEAAVKNIL
ncbi:aspartate/glutamate racemase family protein [Polaribacter sp. Z014]|uniref:aspartate/glutamate racemase family protein n=1 Tax=Polaribacter sp. Z014 TaxID=2927126 RepID=UPI00202150D4|nr:aspartate/glutamate racemase family protein [Polaribacter sp. Z014]MCL7764705.1 aspartate/glutamate racemase family protein [Polaribacter sp. Z014]